MTEINNQKHNTESSCADLVLGRIDKEKLAPKGRWYFVLKNEVFWGIGVISVIIGSCSVAAALYGISSSDFNLHIVTHDSYVDFLYDALPFMWLLSIAVFIGLGYMQFKHTSRGYKYPVYMIIGGSMVLACVGGVALHAFGFGESIEREIGPYVPFHRLPSAERQRLWVNSNRGVIAGEVIYVEEDLSSFIVNDFQGRPWVVTASDLMESDIELLNVNDRVRVIGLPTEAIPGERATSTLHACFVLPWDSAMLLPPPEKLSATRATSSKEIMNLPPKNMENVIAINESERKVGDDRITECKGVRPYQLINKMRAEAQY